METPVALHSVAHRVSHQIPAEKAKSGNLNLVLRILPFFPLFPCILQGKKGKTRRKRFRLPDFAFESKMSRQNRATPPEIKVSHLSPDPPVALSSHSQQKGPRGGVAAGSFGFRKRIALQGVSQLQSHQSRYSVQIRVAPTGLQLLRQERVLLTL